MASLLQLVSKWEIQLLVLLSFMLQYFLFLCGCLRRRSSNRFFKLLVWTAYLGADLVATYALGLISRHNNDATAGSRETHQLVFLWAPFLLIHLGGQDTLTAFALEDNNLWLRHLLNLAVQVSLALYLFWKSANNGVTDAQFLALSMLLFVTGTIKYGERTWALWSGVLRTLAQRPLPRYAHQLRENLYKLHPLGKDDVDQLIEQIDGDGSPSDVGVLTVALCSIESVLSFFWHNGSYKPIMHVWVQERLPQPPRLLEILETELGLVYDYIYTKAVVFQTRGGVVLRCISQVAFLTSFLLFLSSNKQRYHAVDTAVTYALFVGGFLLEFCAVLTTVRSPWTWAWLEARCCSSFLTSGFIRWQRKGKWWSHSMGQYNMHNYLGQHDDQSTSSWKHRVMPIVRRVVDKCCGVEHRFWISKLLDTRFIEVDKEIVECIFHKVVEYAGDPKKARRPYLPEQWASLGALLERVLPSSDATLNWHAIATLHTYTEGQLRKYRPSPSDVGNGSSTHVLVRKISRYIVYLLATQPEMLPISRDAQNNEPRQEKTGSKRSDDPDGHLIWIKLHGTANYVAEAAEKAGDNSINKDVALLSRAKEMLTKMGVSVSDFSLCTKEDLLETKEAWIRLLIYIAGRSRPEFHATRLCRGGELLTFVWLFMAHRKLGDSVLQQILTTDTHASIVRSLVLFPTIHDRKEKRRRTSRGNDSISQENPVKQGKFPDSNGGLTHGVHRLETSMVGKVESCFVGDTTCENQCMKSEINNDDNNNISGTTQESHMNFTGNNSISQEKHLKWEFCPGPKGNLSLSALKIKPSMMGKGAHKLKTSMMGKGESCFGDRSCENQCTILEIDDNDSNNIPVHESRDV